MKLFNKKEKIILNSEQQKEALIEKLENAHIDYKIREDKGSFSNGNSTYIVRINATDMRKII